MGLEKLREAAAMTQLELAEKAGVHNVKISQIELGVIKPENITLRTAQRLAQALGCEPKDLLESGA